MHGSVGVQVVKEARVGPVVEEEPQVGSWLAAGVIGWGSLAGRGGVTLATLGLYVKLLDCLLTGDGGRAMGS